MHRLLDMNGPLALPPAGQRVGRLAGLWTVLLPCFRAALSAGLLPCLVVCLLALSACGGPGVGGTGTGATVDPLPAFGASASPLCSSELAASLSCPASTGGATPSTGTAAVGYGDGLAPLPTLPPAQARFEGDRIDFQVPCQQLRFSGQWGQLPGQAARFYGWVDQAGAMSLASLTVQVQGSQLVLQLRDAQGRALADARTLSRLPVAPPAGAAACG
jgi:hypothetical protein